jgi:hypothetical protein
MAAARARALSVRTLVVAVLLLLVPLLTYWSTTFHAYGLRDDYSNLREAHEEVGKVVMFCASHARPLYGWLLQTSFGQIDTVQNLQWLRFAGSVLLGALSLASYRGLRALGWSGNQALAFAVLLALIPSSQVIASWAVGWPYPLAALLAFAAFFSADAALALGLRGGARTAGQWLVAIGLLVVSALVYQPSTLFYVVPLAAALIVRRRRSATQTLRWAGAHVGLLVASLGVAYCTMSVLYAAHVFVKSPRVAFETLWADKFFWFLGEPLPNALSLFVVNDDNGRDGLAYWACAAAVGLILAAGVAIEWRRHGRERGLVYLAGLTGLPLVAFAISMVASERYATYRTILAMTAVLLCFLIASLSVLTERLNTHSRRALAALVLFVAVGMAQHHAYSLVAVPQGNEWALIVNGAKQLRLGGRPDALPPSVFAIASAPSDISTASIYHDEFGSISTNSEWVPREMFKRAMHDLHPEISDVEARYRFATGKFLPLKQHFDLIIDLHRLHRFYKPN